MVLAAPGQLLTPPPLVVVRLAVVTLPPRRSTAPAVAGCRLVGCSVVSGVTLRDAKTGIKDRYEPGM